MKPRIMFRNGTPYVLLCGWRPSLDVAAMRWVMEWSERNRATKGGE